MYVLDTNVLSELRAGKSRIEPAVIRWAQSVPLNLSQLLNFVK